MRHNIVQEAFGLRLRPVHLEDASFILELRRHPTLKRFIGDTPPDTESQGKWLRDYFEKSDDYYFCFELEKSSKAVGTAGIYQIQSEAKNAEWGRWVLLPGVMAAPASAYLIFQTAFESLKLKKVYCRTVAANFQVLSLQDRMGAQRNGLEKNGVTIRGKPEDMVLHHVTRELWKSIEPGLAEIAGKAQRFLESS